MVFCLPHRLAIPRLSPSTGFPYTLRYNNTEARLINSPEVSLQRRVSGDMREAWGTLRQARSWAFGISQPAILSYLQEKSERSQRGLKANAHVTTFPSAKSKVLGHLLREG